MAIIIACVVGITNIYSIGLGTSIMQNGSVIEAPKYGGVIFSPMDNLHITLMLPLGGTIGVGAGADFHFLSKPIIPLAKDGNLNFLFGLGGNFVAMFGDDTEYGVRIRVPIGLSWRYKKFDVFLQTVPGVSFLWGDEFEIGPSFVPFEVGFRYWF